MTTLFDPIDFGAISAKNRIIMAPLTRGRATRDHVPTPIMADYYAQRASAGLIITEATGVSRQGLGWAYAPGLWSEKQTEAWKSITGAVHRAGGKIVAQLWHMGRAVHSSFSGVQPVSASATTANGAIPTYQGRQAFEQARPLRRDEIAALTESYAIAARNAVRTGFDGIQIHGANGYLIDQFLRDSSNLRTDDYGGSIPNRIRLLAEITQAIADEIGADRTAVRLSPNVEGEDLHDSDPAALFIAAAKKLQTIGIAFLELRELGPEAASTRAYVPRIGPAIREVFSAPLALNSGFTPASAQSAIDRSLADAISFGRPILANPDFARRVKLGLSLTPSDAATWYSQGPQGYIDYPFAAEHDGRPLGADDAATC